MRYYPVNLDIENRLCLVVGGGRVGERKVRRLLECGARVTVVSPEATQGLKAMAAAGRIVLRLRAYEEQDLEGVFLVFCATDDGELNRQLTAAAERRGLLSNIADRPEESRFILPSVVRRGDLLLTVSTSGRSPAFAKALRADLERQFGPEYADFLDIMGAVRERLLGRSHDPEAHRRIFSRLIAGGLLERVRSGDAAGVEALVSEALGEDVDVGLRPDDINS